MATTQRESVTLGGGCFWCLDAIYRELRGVEQVVSGYAGGAAINPSYKDVCSGTTGHAEVVQVTFDPTVIGFGDILDVFFTIHDPTTRDRQGADIGSQYRSVILYRTPEEKRAAESKIAQLEAQHLWPAPIVTQVQPLGTFYPAERYHQDYFANNAEQPYCQIVIDPKVAKFRKRFLDKLKK